MSEYGLEVRDSEGNVIIDPSTFTVRQVASRFISANALIAKVGRSFYTGAVDFPWAEARYGMQASVTQLGLPPLPPTTSDSVLATIARNANIPTAGINSVDKWALNTPRLPVVAVYDGFVRLSPAAHAFNADVWISLYVVV